MSYRGSLPKRMIGRFNSCVLTLRSSPRWGRTISGRLTVVTYTGRRSGRTFSTPVAFRRTGDTVTIGVRFPEAKTWWRNFLAEGGPISLQLDGADRTGHAVAGRDEAGRVTVTVHLDG
ncbi:nitroreductase/quinone reductase family protein [Streptosporangium algeriense]|uniref:Nitroreductase/quinone reductase family protein n=1 Tax=Streptosporangium algeriense TaxID=1682748 RepID=A0ABW3DPN5_9ACTN